MNQTKIIDTIIKHVFKDYFDENGGGIENPRNRWIVHLVLVSKDWFRGVSQCIDRVVIHSNTSIKQVEQLERSFKGQSRPYSIFGSHALKHVQFESLDRPRQIDQHATQFYQTLASIFTNSFDWSKNNIQSLLFIDSDNLLNQLVNVGSVAATLENSTINKLVVSSSATPVLDVEWLARLVEQCNRLETMYFRDDEISKHLTLLSIESCQPVCSAQLFTSLLQCKKLEILKVSGGSLTDDTVVESLVQVVSSIPSLYYLSVADNGLQECEQHLANALSVSSSNIRELDISGNRFNGDHLLPTISKSDRLCSLTLNSDEFTPNANQLLQLHLKHSILLSSFTDCKRRQIDFSSFFK
ncbi:hypothetical protein DFA_03610 [Cavenderia fasciculata]|uniref:Leucine-rich repeat-containing protein n=1 Tax=Cavenderia fasciculata TaxID=261658 RepID=F4PI78_CACFS|nr:uncharacterized protein DFA_03610 [Cavenderia fasciculata]EGG25361.1 hypothetical protein DFA_03610 [Cavenderia fasciculata]|eukprot:XP_004363212.1 hypothetical protein DFA_03610 [Cavenderia fasciculata]